MRGMDDAVVVITGASSGLGAQLARALVAAGARPVLAARRAERLEALRDELGNVDVCVCDVSAEDDRAGLIESTFERHGRIDGLVNNAGIDAFGPASKTDPEAFARVLDVNLVAPFALSRLAARRMREGGGRSIVNVASVMALRSVKELPDAAYVASKAGLVGLTRELASQWGRHGVRVNAVAPGFFPSEMTAGLARDGEEFPPFLTDNTPLGRGGLPGELDDAILFLLSPASSFVTGQVLTVDGGLATR
jgi:NAD(P)-dependent dehydrogenase (short-subunit alcohol dehydrogenase family)